MKFTEIKARRAAPQVAQPKPINPAFISIAELLARLQTAPAVTLTDAAEWLLINWCNAQNPPIWKVNGKYGIVPISTFNSVHEIPLHRLEYVFHSGHFESDGPDSGASIEYDLFGFDRKEFADFLAAQGEPLDLFCPMAQVDAAPAQNTATPAPVVAASDYVASKNKSETTLIFETKVIELMGKFWNERTPGTEPTKGDLCKLVYQEILRTGTRGKRKTTQGMVIDAAKPWKFPIVLPTFVRDSQFNEKRHPFKGDR